MDNGSVGIEFSSCSACLFSFACLGSVCCLLAMLVNFVAGIVRLVMGLICQFRLLSLVDLLSSCSILLTVIIVGSSPQGHKVFQLYLAPLTFQSRFAWRLSTSGGLQFFNWISSRNSVSDVKFLVHCNCKHRSHTSALTSTWTSTPATSLHVASTSCNHHCSIALQSSHLFNIRVLHYQSQDLSTLELW